MNPSSIPDSKPPEKSSVDLSADLRFLHERGLLAPLLADRTTGAPIVWATDAYSSLGPGFLPHDPITPDRLLSTPGFVLRSRAAKDRTAQSSRTKTHAEVFTPLAICQRMLEHLSLPDDPAALLDATCLEIACGEAPFLSTRYDAATGEPVPPDARHGILDRKLRAAAELAENPDAFPSLVLRAYRSTYGFEFQGDNLLIARVNLFMALFEAYPDALSDASLREIAIILAANLVQMDGLSGTIPYPPPPDGQAVLFSLDDFLPPPPKPANSKQQSLFDLDEVCPIQAPSDPRPAAVWTDWRNHQSAFFPPPSGLNTNQEPTMKFDYIIGNPPYQEETSDTSDNPIYHTFMDAAYEVGKKVCLITPARFLFNAGKTPKTWNEKMLNDPHLKVLEYHQASEELFPGINIMGGIAISYHNNECDFGALNTFSPFPKLNDILHKVINHPSFCSLASVIYLQNKWNLNALYKDYPELQKLIGSDGREKRLTTSILSLSVFHDSKTSKDTDILGLVGNQRCWKYVKTKYLAPHPAQEKFKIIVPKSNGSGAIGEVIPTPLIGEPIIGAPKTGVTQSFIMIGAFESQSEAEACLKYIKTKFARAMLGILKITQDNPPEKWKYVPLQDFTSSSDIDWSQPVAGIDRQLYAKYGLTADEVAFVETHVREME